jgi:hypothetical protein
MRKLLIALGALTLLAGCTAQASIPNAKNAAPQSQAFNFPKASCGDKPTGGNDTWYPVFVDGGNLETIHRNFCADAISTVRKDSKVQTIQVASFTNRDKAIEFAKAVGGNVGQLTDVGSSERQPQSAAGSDEAILTANDPDSQISLHDSPSLTGKDLGYGVVGDRVIVISQTTVEGYPWYQVRFPRSGAIGWIRGDFVSVSKGSQPSPEPVTSSNNSDQKASATRTTRGGDIAAFTESDLDEALKYIIQKDDAALNQLLQSERVFVLKSGVEVHIDRCLNFMCSKVAIRPVGQTTSIYTHKEAVN